MTLPTRALPRRDFLRGLGASIALPALPSLANTATAAAGANLATTAGGHPLRMAFVYAPNGVNVDRWRAQQPGSDYALGESLESLTKFKDQMQFFGGLGHQNGTAGRDGAGDHARAGASFLTGARPKKTAAEDIRLGVSVDQFAAQRLGYVTRLPSLELSCDASRKSGSCDSGYSCAYQYNLSWQSETQPVAAEANPRLAFERLFGSGTPEQRQASLKRRLETKKSLLDFVTEDVRQLNQAVGKEDRRKLDQYLSSVRAIEQQIERAEAFGAAPDPRVEAPDGIPREFRDHIRLMYDLLALAFETDSTRVATFLLSHDGSNRNFPDLGVPEGHHELSHHGNDQEKLEKIARIDQFYAEQFAYFLDLMSTKHDADGTPILDNSMIVYGCGLADGNRHAHHDLPVLLAGRGGGALAAGRFVKLDHAAPMTDLFVSMLGAMGLQVDNFGDSTGKLAI